MKTLIKTFIFGKVKEGEKLPKPKTFPERGIDKHYEQWCKEFRVGMLYDRKIVFM